MPGQRGMKRIFVTPLDTVDLVDKEGVGVKRYEGDNTYIYARGVASTVAGDFVAIEHDYTTARLTTGVGATPKRVGIAMAALVADRYGWYQIGGKHPAANVTTGVTSGAALGTSATAGRVGAAGAIPHAISNVIPTATAASNLAPVYLDNPWVLPHMDQAI